MCCGQGTACAGTLTGWQVRDASRALAEAFGSPRARYETSAMATMVRESRAAAAYWGEVFACGWDVMDRGGPAEEYLACRTAGPRPV